ncbi:MAG: Mrp/NBP35 family ATP-binding protein [Planctomycetota bacterium]|nr:Mrp/NBP35 family ATP-binding protein [Planctomycetota bacterium]
MAKRYADMAGDGGSNILGQVRSQGERLRARLSGVRNVVAITSGKGGVGKSVITASLAALLSQAGEKVGVLDADINGPSIGKMLGVRDQEVAMGADGLAPAIGPNGIRVMSMDLLLPGDDVPVTWDGPDQEAYVWRGTMEVGALREFLTDTVWGELSVLLLDLPPGAERLPNVTSLIPDLSGVVVVTIPSEVSLLVVRKAITVARETGVPIIGVVENMAGYACTHCGKEGALFRSVGSAPPDLGIPHLGTVPFDPRLTEAADRGTPFVLDNPDEPVSKILGEIAQQVRQFLKSKSEDAR